MKRSSYSATPYGQMRDRKKKGECQKKTNKRVPYKYLLLVTS